MPVNYQEEAANLLKNIKANLSNLDELLKECSDERGYEDPIYRFYHQSYKVLRLQVRTERIVEALHSLAPHLPLNEWFTRIVHEGTGKPTDPPVDNDRWLEITRPIVEAFFHAHYFLAMTCKYGRELETPPQTMPSGWAAVLYLFNLR